MVNLPPSETDAYQKALEALEACIGELFVQAAQVAEDYMSFVDGMEGSRQGWKTMSKMQLACNRRGNHLDLRWTGIKWIGTKGERKSIRVAIPKTKDAHTYPVDKLKLHAQDWELEKVIETEHKLHGIRRKASHLVKSIMSLRNTIRLAKILAGQEDPDRDTNEDGGEDD